MRERMGALENQAEQTWTSHRVTLLNKINSVAGDALDNQIRSLLNEATAELQKASKAKSRTCHKFNKKSKVNRLRAEKELFFFSRNELSQSLAQGSHCQNLCTTRRSGAFASPSDIQQSQQESDHLNVYGRNLETEKLACQSAVRFREGHVAHIPLLRGIIDLERQESTTLQAEAPWGRKSTALSTIGKVQRRGCPVASSL